MGFSRAGTFLVCAVALCASGCGDSHEAVARDMLSAQQELCAVLEGVNDAASAQQAATQLEALAGRVQAIKKRSGRLGSAPKAVADSLRTKYEDEYRKTAESVRQRLAQLDPQYALQLQDALSKIMSNAGN